MESFKTIFNEGIFNELVFNEGIENVFKRHIDSHSELVKRLEEMDLQLIVNKPHRLPMLNAVRIPNNVDDVKIRRFLRDSHKIEIGGGLGPLARKIWRIGLMGHTARIENIERLAKALKQILQINK